jgi:hypothetical protein
VGFAKRYLWNPVLVFMVQGGVGLHPGGVNLVQPLGALIVFPCGGGLVLLVLGQVVPRAKRALRSRIARRRRRLAAAGAELRARVMMDELCPYGWRAQITLDGTAEEQSDDTPERHRDRVALEWTAFEDERSRVVVVRRVCAPTLSEALDAMVADRRTDETLQRVEQAALADGAEWPDL